MLDLSNFSINEYIYSSIDKLGDKLKNVRPVYMVAAVFVSFMSLCGIRAVATPIEDNQGGFADELFHFARSLQNTVNLAEVMGIPEPDLDAKNLLKFSTRVDNVCELGVRDSTLCPGYYEAKIHDLVPIGSGAIRGRGVYLMHGLIQFLLPELNIESRLIFGRIFAICIVST